MITLFRRIREKLIVSGSLTKYLLYAVGEILLVMIGILLALQVNTWNESVKNHKEELFYYDKLKENLRQDTTNLVGSMNRVDASLIVIDQIIDEFYSKENELLDADIAFALIRVESYSPETSTWDNLKSTGKINIIQRQSVIDSLTNYYNIYLMSTKQWIEANKDYSRNHLGPYLMKFDDIRLDFGGTSEFKDVFEPQKRSVKEYREDVFIRNALIYKRTNLTGLRSLFLNDYKRAVNILNLLDDQDPTRL
ncbi:DUF6090 family protein [Balneola sp. MJW-20]|uniref:DUF6090 family protein n=1 Tax=Gracilimonas aurantiaca TaxID=3234185 RepID=UPI0034662835